MSTCAGFNYDAAAGTCAFATANTLSAGAGFVFHKKVV